MTPDSSSTIVKSGQRSLTAEQHGLLVDVGDAHSVQLLGDREFGLRPDELAPARAVQEVLVEEARPRARLDLDRAGISEKVGHPARDLGRRRIRVAAQRPQFVLVEDDELVPVPGDGGVEQLPRERTAVARKHEVRSPELASLGLVHRQRVGELEIRGTLLAGELSRIVGEL